MNPHWHWHKSQYLVLVIVNRNLNLTPNFLESQAKGHQRPVRGQRLHEGVAIVVRKERSCVPESPRALLRLEA